MTATEVPRRVLIAEDETIIRLDLRGLLEKNGFDVCGEARDGVEAVELAASLEPDVIVMDVKMPRLDGIEAAKRILEKRPVPIVMLTAFGQEELVARAVDVGVFGYLAKPFREQDVIPALVAAQARHAEFAEVKLHASSLLEALEARKSIERAKGILMAKEGLSEEEAFARLRRASQRSGRPMKVIADARSGDARLGACVGCELRAALVEQAPAAAIRAEQFAAIRVPKRTDLGGGFVERGLALAGLVGERKKGLGRCHLGTGAYKKSVPRFGCSPAGIVSLGVSR